MMDIMDYNLFESIKNIFYNNGFESYKHKVYNQNTEGISFSNSEYYNVDVIRSCVSNSVTTWVHHGLQDKNIRIECLDLLKSIFYVYYIGDFSIGFVYKDLKTGTTEKYDFLNTSDEEYFSTELDLHTRTKVSLVPLEKLVQLYHKFNETSDYHIMKINPCSKNIFTTPFIDGYIDILLGETV